MPISVLQADQADKVREYTKPHIERVLDRLSKAK
jgi:hypothetical protein